MNITEPIRRAARVNPDAVAIIRADATPITYGVLEHAIDRMALYTGELGLRAGDVASLAITGPDESLGLTLALGLARIGVTSAEPGVPPRHVRMHFRSGGASAPGTVSFDASWMTNRPAGPDHAPVPIHTDGNTLFRLFASSGTTGTPKHIIVTHAIMAHRVYGRWMAEGAGPDVRIIGAGLGSNRGMDMALRTLWAGGTIVLSNPAQAAAAITRHGVTSIATSPVSLRAILDALPPDQTPFPTLRRVEIGGSRLPEALWRLAAERLCPTIISNMGSSEAGGIASAPARDLTGRPDAVGYLWPGVEVQALDGENRPLPPGREGVLRLRGDRIAAGYFARDDGEHERFQDGWFHSGDIGAVGPDGMLTLTGRTTDVINAGGVKIHPRVIESAFLSLPTVLDAAAFGVPDSHGITRVCAAIVSRVHIDDAVLSDFCAHALPRISPTTILRMKALPRNENGKLMREQLVDIALHLARRPSG